MVELSEICCRVPGRREWARFAKIYKQLGNKLQDLQTRCFFSKIPAKNNPGLFGCFPFLHFLRPLLMQSELESVEKVHFSTFA